MKAVTENSKAKVYQEVLEQIRKFIEQNDLSPGDRLPSERYLAETLNAGRSSVREALRALELLGLIETKQGEGTFLKTYRPYHTVEILSTFILHESRTREELLEVKKLLEQQAAQIAMQHITEKHLIELKQNLEEQESGNEKHFHFFFKLFTMSNNNLLLKVWQLIEEFSRTVHAIEYAKSLYIQLLDAIYAKQKEKVEEIIEQLYENICRKV
ncbi:DNA-binding FadR family transcriptional regulator [Salirhabdus euzebyi]|uniref:DNA-binding FadR family transcriptional regulator n=1 Tax=Salirhabdus euzebyi TaxID=394506 RepID=A0A841Q1P3_9BACI|nr:GntR family transcriptional regulator [Salirhabdus euzebyi]MBB6452092.1 DNA-binding FadR family transcriptional regulator [Salirhabdus euzebyi]